MEDQFIIFLQADSAGVIHLLLQETSKWKEAAQKGTTRAPLRQHLFSTLTQELVTRVERLAQSKPQDKAWQKVLECHMVTGDGAWNYLQWDAAQKKLMPLPTKSIQMVKMQEHIQELNELAQRTEMILRFKSLKRTNANPGTQIIPWLLQVSMRSNRLWELLNLLAHSSVWQLAHGRLRPHQSRTNPLAESLAKSLKDRS